LYCHAAAIESDRVSSVCGIYCLTASTCFSLIRGANRPRISLEACRHFSSTECLLTFGVLIEAEFVRTVIYKLAVSVRSRFIASTQRTIKLSACKEPFDVDGLVTGADKLLSSAAIARVDSHLHQT